MSNNFKFDIMKIVDEKLWGRLARIVARSQRPRGLRRKPLHEYEILQGRTKVEILFLHFQSLLRKKYEEQSPQNFVNVILECRDNQGTIEKMRVVISEFMEDHETTEEVCNKISDCCHAIGVVLMYHPSFEESSS